MVDIATIIANESIRRQVEQVMDEIVVDALPDCPIWNMMSPEQVKRLMAINVVMARVIELSHWN